MNKPTILFGIPSVSVVPEFLDSIVLFFDRLKKEDKYDFQIQWIRGESLVEAQNKIARMFLESKRDYLIFLEEDHWGHLPEMVDMLIDNPPFSAINYFSRHAPYPSTLMLKDKKGKYVPTNFEGVKEVELCGFGMTLISRDILEKLSKPIFEISQPGKIGTDRKFCDKVKDELGIKPKGIFDYLLTHMGIHEENVMKYRCEFYEHYFKHIRNKVGVIRSR